MDKLATLLSGLSKSYLYTKLARDAGRFIRRNLSDLDFDKEEWLHKAGLSSYRPASSWMLFVTGALAGAGFALALAPKAGRQLRSEVKDAAMTLFNRVESEAAEGTRARS